MLACFFEAEDCKDEDEGVGAIGRQHALDKKCKEIHNNIKRQNSPLNYDMPARNERGDIFEKKDSQLPRSIIFFATGG